ncbi:LysR family transcriptional regulator [Aciditerrimonas ferrireducens]|uniref:LysR family transcriptional regulator n=1 Tax=Aciditerrimonas ferrireducens TaxID=667306 RepID=A0ABV6C4U9_9ACTN|nr:LysR family transcriptional regulator [Aciditerrimonas ferrireducens]MCK4177640.1 LysR family transcriptional regulator [Aciditerrimonas ferrireducens]
MELRHLQAFLAVVDHGSFSAAAEALGTVQSNVSAQVARLERELGATLLERSGGRLTTEGQVVLERARRVLSEVEALVADLGALREELAGTVRAGMIGTLARWVVPALLADLGARHPKLQLVVAEGTSATLEGPLLTGRLDFALLSHPLPSRDLRLEPLLAEALLFVSPLDQDPFPGAEHLTMAELAQVPLLLPPPGSAFRVELDAAAAAAGVALRARAELDGLRLIASLVFDGHGAAVLPASAIPQYLQGRVRARPVEGLPSRTVGVALRRRGLPSAPARAVIQAVERLARRAEALPPGLQPIEPEVLRRAEGSLRTLGVPND